MCVCNLYIVCQNGYWLHLSYRKGGLAKFFVDLVAYKVTVVILVKRDDGHSSHAISS